MRILLPVLVVLALVAPATAQIVTPSEILRSSVSNVIRPQVKAFAESGLEMAAGMAGLCAEPGSDRLAETRDAFANLATAYGRMEFFRLGPLLEDNRADRILFWPDRRSIGLKQVQQILAEQDADATGASGLYAKSVAVQGLGALEFVLFGTGWETLSVADGAFRCAYGRAIANNLAQIGADIVDAWADPEGIAGHLMQPDARYADYRTETESLEALVGLVAHGVEAMRDTRVNPFIAGDDGRASPKLALFWRSNQTIPMLRANMDGLRRLVTYSGVVADPALAAQIDVAFDRAEAALGTVTAPVEEAVNDPTQAAALADFVEATRQLQTLIGEDLSATLGLSVGFSSLDGD